MVAFLWGLGIGLVAGGGAMWYFGVHRKKVPDIVKQG